MTNAPTSNEREERLKQIRERHEHNKSAANDSEQPLPKYLQTAYADIDFLLSLLDSSTENGCGQCAGPHDFDTSIPSPVWNQVIRARGLSEHLCLTCIVREFVRVGQGFTANLWSEEFIGVPIEVVVNGQNAKDVEIVQKENNSLRHQLNDAAQSVVNEATKVSQLMQSAATAMRDKCVQKVKEYERLYEEARHTGEKSARRKRLLQERVLTCIGIAAGLESLTLDQVDQEKQQS